MSYRERVRSVILFELLVVSSTVAVLMLIEFLPNPAAYFCAVGLLVTAPGHGIALLPASISRPEKCLIVVVASVAMVVASLFTVSAVGVTLDRTTAVLAVLGLTVASAALAIGGALLKRRAHGYAAVDGRAVAFGLGLLVAMGFGVVALFTTR
jgi:hypothetical protein